MNVQYTAVLSLVRHFDKLSITTNGSKNDRSP
jgi:hypothetical protein